MSSTRSRRASTRAAERSSLPAPATRTPATPSRPPRRASTGPTTDHNGVQVGKRPHIGELVSVWWADDQVYYPGRVTRFDADRNEHVISYDDGETESLDMALERWKRINPRPPVNVAAERQAKEKSKQAAQSRQQTGKPAGLRAGTRRGSVSRRAGREGGASASSESPQASEEENETPMPAGSSSKTTKQAAGHIVEETMEEGAASPERSTRRASAIAPRPPPPPMPPSLPSGPPTTSRRSPPTMVPRRTPPKMVPRSRPLRAAAASSKLASPGSTTAEAQPARASDPAEADQEMGGPSRPASSSAPAPAAAVPSPNTSSPMAVTPASVPTAAKPWVRHPVSAASAPVHAPTLMDGDFDSVGEDDSEMTERTPQLAQAGAKRPLPGATGASSNAAQMARTSSGIAMQAAQPLPASVGGAVETGEAPLKKARGMPPAAGRALPPAPSVRGVPEQAGGTSAASGAVQTPESGNYESRINEILLGVTRLSSMHSDLDKRFLAANLVADRRYQNTKTRYEETDRRFASITTYMISLKNNVDALHKKVDALMAAQGGRVAAVGGNTSGAVVMNRSQHVSNHRTVQGQVQGHVQGQVMRTTQAAPRQMQSVSPYGNANSNAVGGVTPSPTARPIAPPRRISSDRGPVRERLANTHVEGMKKRVLALMGRQVLIWVLETDHEIRGCEVSIWTYIESERCMKRCAELLSRFPDYGYAQRVLQSSLRDSDMQLAWFSDGPTPQHLRQARTNYDVWDPPPSNAEWLSEERLLILIANVYRAALNAYKVTAGESTLDVCVAVANNAALNVARMPMGAAGAAGSQASPIAPAPRAPAAPARRTVQMVQVQGSPANQNPQMSQGAGVHQRAGQPAAASQGARAGQGAQVNQAGVVVQRTGVGAGGGMAQAQGVAQTAPVAQRQAGGQAVAQQRQMANGVAAAAGRGSSVSPQYARQGGQGFSNY